MRACSAGAPPRHDDRRGRLMVRLSRFGDLTTPPGKECKMQSFDDLREE